MTENEAIKWQESFKKTYKGFPNDVDDACDIAINALEEIQQYRDLGTVEELRLAKEKQIPKKPINNKHTVSVSSTAVKVVDWWKCGKCNGDLTRQFACCPYCQTVIDWSDEE